MVRDAAQRLAETPDVGAVSDSVIAKRLGISRKTVLAWRKRKGIRAWDDPARLVVPRAAEAAEPGPTGKRAKPSKLDAYVALLGTMPDRAVAERVGVSPENVRMYRQRRGIAAAWREGEGPPTRVEEALSAFEAELGRVADAVVAERAGVSRSAVTQYRAKRGIAAGRGDGAPALPMSPTVAPTFGFEVRVGVDAEEEVVTVLAHDASGAVAAAAAVGEVLALRKIGRVL